MRGPSFRPTAVLTSLALALPGLLPAQVQTVTLSKPDAEFPDPFDQVTAVRELRDGRVVVTDVFAKTVSLADFRTGSGTAIGREGQGPGEYAFPSGLIALPGDTTLIVDPGQRRFLKIGPDMKPVATISFPDGVGGIMSVRGADRQGRLYFQGSPFRGGPLGGGERRPDDEIPDSVSILRWQPGTKTLDSIGRVKIPAIARATSGGANARSVIMRAQPFSASDDWSPTPDGRIGVARVGEYHVEWLGAARVVGPMVRAERVAVSKADKDEYTRRAQDQRGRVMMIEGGNGPRGGGAPPVPRLPEPDWPEFKPPFVANSAAATPDGQLWVERSQAAGTSRLYDVFDAQGRLVRQVRLAAGSRVVGFGATSVYVAHTDEDDLQHLQRFRRP